MSLDVDSEDENDQLKKLEVEIRAKQKVERDLNRDLKTLESFTKHDQEIPLQALSEKYSVLRPKADEVKASLLVAKKEPQSKKAKPQPQVVPDVESEVQILSPVIEQEIEEDIEVQPPMITIDPSAERESI